jgi:hypothetical protein
MLPPRAPITRLLRPLPAPPQSSRRLRLSPVQPGSRQPCTACVAISICSLLSKDTALPHCQSIATRTANAAPRRPRAQHTPLLRNTVAPDISTTVVPGRASPHHTSSGYCSEARSGRPLRSAERQLLQQKYSYPPAIQHATARVKGWTPSLSLQWDKVQERYLNTDTHLHAVSNSEIAHRIQRRTLCKQSFL